MSISIEDFEKLLTSFQAAVPAVDELISKIDEVLKENKKMKMMISNEAFIKSLDKDVLDSLKVQRLTNRCVLYSILSDEEHTEDIVEYAKKLDDHEIIKYLLKSKKSIGVEKKEILDKDDEDKIF